MHYAVPRVVFEPLFNRPRLFTAPCKPFLYPFGSIIGLMAQKQPFDRLLTENINIDHYYFLRIKKFHGRMGCWYLFDNTWDPIKKKMCPLNHIERKVIGPQARR